MKLPVVFVSHGAPVFANETGDAAANLQALGKRLAHARGIVVLSPHWMTPGLRITSGSTLNTIHDFYGFPAELYELQYPAQGDSALATRVRDALAASDFEASFDAERGLDHGAWVPLRHMFPNAQIPIVQLSLPQRASAEDAYAIGRALRPLADEGILIIGSGSLTHNLRDLRADGSPTVAYARNFVDAIRAALELGDDDSVVHALDRSADARLAHPTSEHYLPLPFALGAAAAPAAVTLLDGGIRYGALSMDSFVFEAH